ncbi:MAG: NAD(P)-dependent oxidoreductase [Corynebacteriales bacterium]|nr:NAD(P)-dependent oxidoreductase [Mycobacteriales bacterium]
MPGASGAHITLLGLGAMGSALAQKVHEAGYRTTVWNRTPARAAALARQGAHATEDLREAIHASPVVIACLLDHASVHEALDPVADALRGRALINVTTTSPNESREIGTWARENDIDYLDGGIMAVPSMIGNPGAAILYSGSAKVFEEHRSLLNLWADATYYGEDAGMASLYDLAMLSGMYVMFAGFMHGAAMVGSENVSASEFAAKAVPFLRAMVDEMPGYAKTIDDGDYAGPGQQSLEFSDLTHIVTASQEQGVSSAPIAMVQELIRRQLDAGYGREGFARIYESLRNGPERKVCA